MTDQHKGGYQGGSGRGGNSLGPRQGGFDKRSGGNRGERRFERSEGGYRKDGKGGSYGGPKRDGNKPYGDRKPGGKSYGNRDGKPYGKPGSKPYGNRDGKPSGDRDRKPYGSRDGKPYGDRDRKPYGDRDRKPYGKRDGKPSGDRKSFGGSRFDDRKGAPRGGKPFKKHDGGQRRFGSSQGRFDGKRDGSFDRRKFNDEKPRMTDDVQVQSVDETAVQNAASEETSASRDEERTFARDGRPRRDERAGGRPRDARGPRGDRRGPKPSDKPRLSPGRAAACAIGKTVRERDAFTAEITPSVLATFEGISPEDAAFATKIARGVTATIGTLDEFIDRNLKSPDDIGVEVRDALRVSAYELLFLGKNDYAAVDQGVELVRSVAPAASGLANAVLRKMATSAKKFPYGNPDLSLQVLARSQAFPLWLAKRLMNEMGLKQATAFMRASNADAPVYIAVNAIKAKDEDIVEIFDQAGSLMKESETVAGCYLVEDARVLRNPEVRALFENGSVCVSDESAQAIAALACPKEDVEAFLEIGAGRGTKTILLQSNAVRAFGRTIPMVSVDDHAFKGNLLEKRTAAYGINSVRPLTMDARKLSEKLPEASFDAVFVDAPCTGVGTLRRHPEIRWRLTAAQITDMSSVEYDILAEAAKMVKPGGTLTYATCTVFAEENENVVERFRKTKFGESFEVEETLSTTLSASGPDAHYAVRLRRVR